MMMEDSGIEGEGSSDVLATVLVINVVEDA